jgi:hypothetical protein
VREGYHPAAVSWPAPDHVQGAHRPTHVPTNPPIRSTGSRSPSQLTPVTQDEHLPFDPETGELDEAVWARWLQWDPVFMAERYAESLKSLRLLYVECGSRDQYNLHHGARILRNRLTRLGIRHEYQEFDDDHTAVNYRYVESFHRLCTALQA